MLMSSSVAGYPICSAPWAPSPSLTDGMLGWLDRGAKRSDSAKCCIAEGVIEATAPMPPVSRRLKLPL